ncbi:MAG: lipid A biosynthesis acyltransferase [Thioalkalivibrionaceae bacterium]
MAAFGALSRAARRRVRGAAERLALVLLWWLHRGLPLAWSRRAVRGFAIALGGAVRRISAKRVAIARANLRACFPDLDEADVETWIARHYRIAAQVFLDYGLLWFGDETQHRRFIEIEGYEHFAAARSTHSAVVVLAPHALALDFGGLRLSAEALGVSFTKPMKNPRVEALNRRSRMRYGGLIVHRSEGLRPVFRAMRQGRFFYYLPDEDLGAEGACFVPFFGVPKATLTALTRVARISGAAVLPTLSVYDVERDRYRLMIQPAMHGFPSGDDCADARAMNAAIESLLSLAPEQYLWTMKLFRTRPPGTSPIYR